MKLANQIYNNKAFYTVSNSVLIKKLQMYGIRGINLAWFRSYLTNRKHYIWLGQDLKTGTQNILCGVPQGSMLGPLPFLLYVTDLPSFLVLDPIMFVDDTNLFFEHKELKILFSIANE